MSFVHKNLLESISLRGREKRAGWETTSTWRYEL